MRFKITSIPGAMLMFVVLSVACMWAGHASAVQLTAEQVKLLQGMPASEKARLAGQAGVTGAQPGKNMAIDAPPSIQSRVVGSGPIEQQVEGGSADAAQQNAALGAGANAAAPVGKVAGQTGAEQLEVRRAFVDFVAECKPLVVDARGPKEVGYHLVAGLQRTFGPGTDVAGPAVIVDWEGVWEGKG